MGHGWIWVEAWAPPQNDPPARTSRQGDFKPLRANLLSGRVAYQAPLRKTR
jgi:hypothetical protein